MNSDDPAVIARHARLEEALKVLGEHFDTVQIFATVVEEDGSTWSPGKGCGNWYARYGQIRMFCSKEDERERVEVRAENEP